MTMKQQSAKPSFEAQKIFVQSTLSLSNTCKKLSFSQQVVYKVPITTLKTIDFPENVFGKSLKNNICFLNTKL